MPVPFTARSPAGPSPGRHGLFTTLFPIGLAKTATLWIRKEVKPLPTAGSGTSHEIVGSAILVCLAVLVWLVLVPLASLVLTSEGPRSPQAARRPQRSSRISGRLIPIG
jgi:hypothetical protein